MQLKKLALAALLLVAIASPQHYLDGIHIANEASRIYAAQAITRYGTLNLSPVFDDYFTGWRTAPNVDVAVKDGAYLLDKAPGITLAAVPVVAALDAAGASYRWQAWLLALLFSALPTIGFVFAFRRWGAPWPLAAASVLATPWLVYAGLLFGHAACAALLGIGLLLALGPLDDAAPPKGGPSGQGSLARRTRGDRSPSGPGDRRTPLLGGLALGGAVLVEYTAALLVVIALAALAADPTRRARLRWVVLGGVAPALVLAIWNTIAFGAPWRLSYGFKADAALAATHDHGVYGIGAPTRSGLYGLLVSPSRGLFFYAPWLVAGVIGAAWATASSTITRAWRIVLPVGIVAFVLVIAGFPDWNGGRAYGPRYLVPAIPLFAIATAALLRLARWRYLVPILAGLVAAGVVLAVVGAYVDVYSSPHLANPAFEINVPILLWTDPAPTLWSTFSPRIVGFALGVVALVCALAGALPRPRAVIPPVLAAAVALAFLAIATRPSTADRARLVRERALAHRLLDQPEAAAAIER